MPVIFAELASTYKPSDVSNPKSPAAAANGQYMLITREAYDAVGGHAAVATDLLEDVALAKRVKATGPQNLLPFRRRRRPHAHVPHFLSTARRLDQEPCPAISRHRKGWRPYDCWNSC